MVKKEKRNQARAHYKDHIIYSLDNRESHFIPYFNAYFDAFYGADMMECSEDGMSFTADRSLKKGSRLLLKATDGRSELTAAKDHRGTCTAEVVWSKKCDTCKTGGHTVGVQFND